MTAYKLIYVAGPYRGPNAWAVAQNVRAAEVAGLALMRECSGVSAVIPHSMNAHYEGALGDDHWLASTLELLRRCDGVLLLSNWRDSSGARAEREEALALGLPVFDMADPNPWEAVRRWRFSQEAAEQDGAEQIVRGILKQPKPDMVTAAAAAALSIPCGFCKAGRGEDCGGMVRGAFHATRFVESGASSLGDDPLPRPQPGGDTRTINAPPIRSRSAAEDGTLLSRVGYIADDVQQIARHADVIRDAVRQLPDSLSSIAAAFERIAVAQEAQAKAAERRAGAAEDTARAAERSADAQSRAASAVSRQSEASVNLCAALERNADAQMDREKDAHREAAHDVPPAALCRCTHVRSAHFHDGGGCCWGDCQCQQFAALEAPQMQTPGPEPEPLPEPVALEAPVVTPKRKGKTEPVRCKCTHRRLSHEFKPGAMWGRCEVVGCECGRFERHG